MQELGLSNNSLNNYYLKVRGFFKYYNIKLPPKIHFSFVKSEWVGLSNDDLKFIISCSSPLEKALYSFMASTGMRISDVVKLSIGDFVSAIGVSSYGSIEDFINMDDKFVLGYWCFNPCKTMNLGIECKVFNSSKSSYFIFKYLDFKFKSVKEYNFKYGCDVSLGLDSKLFSSCRNFGVDGFTLKGLSSLFHRRILLLRELRGLRFSPHLLRKYVFSTFANHNISLHVAQVFEGHSPLGNDRSYTKFSRSFLEEEYLKCLDDLTFIKRLN